MASLSSPGIGSGLDVNAIVSQLMAVEQQPLTKLTTKEATYQAKISAFGSLKGALSTFQTSLSSLSTAAQFAKYTATSSDTSVLTTSTTSTATGGNYAINVSQLAQSQSLYAAGQNDTSSAIGSGTSTTISFDFGTISGGTLTSGVYSGATFTANPNIASGSITIDSSNNTLSGIRDAINAAQLGVTASIVNDGGTSPYRLVLTSSKTGVASSLKISVSGDATLQTLLANDPAATQNLVQSQAAQDAALTVNGLAVKSSTNTISNSLQGVTLNLLKTGTSNVTVAFDQNAVQKAIQGFVSSYNEANKTIVSLTSYNAESKKGGLLLGDSTVRGIQSSLRSLVSSNLAVNGTYTSLSQIGVSFQKDGTLAIDNNKLQAALVSNPAAVGALFATTGKTTDALVSYTGSSSVTTPGTYGINVASLATRGSVAGGTAVGPSTLINSSNNTLGFTLDGVTASATLTPGTYTPSQLSALIQSAINGVSTVSSAGLGVTVSESAGVLTIQSKSYGAASNISVTGNAVATLFGTPASTAGTNVSGSIGSSIASGLGQTLTGSGAAQDLKLLINGGATGTRGSVTLTQGLSDKLNVALDRFLTSGGLIANRTDGLQRSIKDVEKQRDALNNRLEATEKRLRAQFNALDATISNLNKTSTYLTQQLATLNGSKNNSE